MDFDESNFLFSRLSGRLRKELAVVLLLVVVVGRCGTLLSYVQIEEK